MLLAGLDFAWVTSRNPSALALGTLNNNGLCVEHLYPSLIGLDTILATLESHPTLSGIAIDASLIINNPDGCRPCEKALNRDYARYRAGCHPTNLSLYPEPASVELSRALQKRGYDHLNREGRWQLECYPHPSLVEIFNLAERHAYKKGSVAERRSGQQELALLLTQLSTSPLLALTIKKPIDTLLDPSYIQQLRGQTLKTNEDALDAIICLYIAGLYATGVSGTCYGTRHDGYIWLPTGLTDPTNP